MCVVLSAFICILRKHQLLFVFTAIQNHIRVERSFFVVWHLFLRMNFPKHKFTLNASDSWNFNPSYIA